MLLIVIHPFIDSLIHGLCVLALPRHRLAFTAPACHGEWTEVRREACTGGRMGGLNIKRNDTSMAEEVQMLEPRSVAAAEESDYGRHMDKAEQRLIVSRKLGDTERFQNSMQQPE